MKYLLLLFLTFATLFANTQEKELNKKVEGLEKPLYTPFVENYILNEIKLLRDENRNLKIQIHESLAKKEVEISNSVINYATSTINNMFYIIATASSILVIIGWTSIKDVNEKIKHMIDEKTSKTIREYEERMANFESDLQKRALQVKQNAQEIELMNTIHSLWLRASQDSTPSGKIEAYDEILELRPEDVEAIAYKADAVLDLGEANWSLNLTNQALLIDDNYSNAYYQRAKAFAVLNQEENAINDLEKAIELNEDYSSEIENDEEFNEIAKLERVQHLISQKAQA